MAAETDSRPPLSPFFEKGNDLLVSHDRLFASLYSALIGGLFVLLIKEDLTTASTVLLSLSAACLVYGLAYTLIHIKLHCSLLFVLGLLVDGVDSTPNLIGADATPATFQRLRRSAQLAFENELLFLFLGVSLAGLAVFAELAPRIGWWLALPVLAMIWAGVASVWALPREGQTTRGKRADSHDTPSDSTQGGI